MKKLVMFATTALLMSTAAFAQPGPKGSQGPQGQEPEINTEEAAQKRTEMMVKKYDLNSKQEARLLELNTEYADLFTPQRRNQDGPRADKQDGPRPGGPGMGPRREGPGAPQGEKPELTEEQKAEMEAKKAEFEAKKEEFEAKREEMKAEFEAKMAERKEKMEAYDAALQDILKKKQYEAYKEDQEARREHGPRHGGPMHGGPDMGPGPRGPFNGEGPAPENHDNEATPVPAN